MINEYRTYQIKTGALGTYLAAFEQAALPLIRKHANLLAFWTSDTGLLNCVHHLWAWEDHSARERQFAALRAERVYQEEFLAIAAPLVVQMNSTLLSPVGFMHDLPLAGLNDAVLGRTEHGTAY